MSQLTLSPQTFKWLQSLELVKQGRRNAEGKIQLDEKVSGRFLDGVMVSRILMKIIQTESEINQSLRSKIKSVKQNSTPAIRLYNWNLIVDVLKYYKFSLNYLQKSKILNLETGPVEEILQYLRRIYYNQNVARGEIKEKSDNSNVIHIKIQGNNNNISNSIKQTQQQPNHSYNINANTTKLQIDIKSISTLSLKQSSNILQLFTILLSKHFKLSPQQTLNLYLDNNKYLTLLIVKGIKDSFLPIISFINQLLSVIDFIVMELLSVNEKQSLLFFFNAIKPCLISNSQDVCLKAISLFDKMLDLYVDNNLQQINILQWLRQQGVYFILKSTKMNDHLLKKSLMFLFKFLQEELFEFIRPVDKCVLWMDDLQKLRFVQIFLVVAQNNLIESLQKSTCLIQWKQYLVKATKKLKSPQQHHLLISIMHEMWQLFPILFEKESESESNVLSDNLITLLKSNIVSSDFMMFVHCSKVMFELMTVLGKRKNNYAPVFYKMLANCLQFESGEERVIFITENFIVAFDELHSLPGKLLVEPLIQSLSRNPTTSSLQLIKHLILSQRLTESQSIELIDITMKVLFQDYLQGTVALDVVFQTIQVVEFEVKEEFLLRNAMLCLAQFYSLAKMVKKGYFQLTEALKKYQGQQHIENQKSSSNNNDALNYNYMTQLKRFLLMQNLIKFLQKIISNQENNDVMNQLQQHVFMTYLKVKIQLQKPQIAKILKNTIMKEYYDIQQELSAVIEQYQRKYKMYLQEIDAADNSKKRSMSLLFGVTAEDEQQSSVIQQSLKQTLNPLYASQSTIIQSPTKLINPFLLKPTNFAIKDLQTLKTKLSRIKVESQNKEKQSQLIEEKNQLIKSIINQKRLVKYGAKNTFDMEYKYLFDFDTVKPQRQINGMPNVELIDLEKQQEDIFVADVQSLMKKYRKVWRFLFYKYSTFGAKQTTRNSQSKTEEKISMAEVWKMHREYGTDFIKKEQSFSIVKAINEAMKRKNDLQNLTYLGFEEYIVQFCITAYNHLGMTTLSPGQKVNKFLVQLKQVTQQKGGNTEIFINPQEAYFLQTDVIKEYNKRLAINPDYILPEGYKKVKQTQFTYHNQFTEPSRQACLQQNYLTVLQVLDSIFSERQELGFHLIQPKTSKIQRTLAKPALFQQITQKMKTYKEGYLLPKKRQVNSTYISGREEKVSPIIIKPEFHPVMIEFSLGIKLGLSGVPLKNKYLGEQVAYWMDDMLDAVENGSNKVQNKGQKRIQNQVIKSKRRVLHNMKQEMREKQKLYKQRSQSVRSQFEKIQVIKQEMAKKKIFQARTKRKQEKLREQMSMRKKLVQFQKAKKFFQQREEKEKQRSRQQQQIKKQQKQEYKKRVDEYFKQKKSQLQEKELNYKKEREYEARKQKQQQERKKQFTKKIYLNVLKKDQFALERIQQFKQKYEQFSQEEFVKRELEQNKKSLMLLFQLLVRYEKSKISTTDKNEISQSTFNYFAVKFGIMPKVLEKNVLGRILVSVWKGSFNKGMGYREFEEGLLRIVVKGKQVLNEMVQKRKQKKNSHNKSLLKGNHIQASSPEKSHLHESALVLEHESNMKQSQRLDSSLILSNNSMASSKLSINERNLAKQYLFDPQGVTVETIRQFMLFLDLPDDKLGVETRWRQVVENKGKEKG